MGATSCNSSQFGANSRNISIVTMDAVAQMRRVLNHLGGQPW